MMFTIIGILLGFLLECEALPKKSTHLLLFHIQSTIRSEHYTMLSASVTHNDPLDYASGENKTTLFICFRIFVLFVLAQEKSGPQYCWCIFFGFVLEQNVLLVPRSTC